MKKKGNNVEDTVGNLLLDIERTDLKITKKMLQRMWIKYNRVEKRMEKRKGGKGETKRKRKSMVIKKKKEKQDKK